jgi:hypothetical protein
MALIVENGQGLADAESLCSVSYADAYHDARGNTIWAALSTPEKEQALRRGTDYIERTYGMRFCGYRVNSTQALSWPRYEARRKDSGRCEYWPSDAVPNPMAQTCAEMSMKAAQGELDKDFDQSKLTKAVTVGPIKKEYFDSDGVIRYRHIDKSMAQFIEGSGSSISMVRS